MEKIGRNEKCPCGSGKKYKNCCENYHKKAFMIVGNGFTCNLLKAQATNIDVNSSKPLKEFNSKDISYNDFIDNLGTFKEMLNEYNKLDFDNDFKIIEQYLKDHKDNKKCICNLNKFLTIAFSKFQLYLDDNVDLTQWDWLKWIKANSDKLLGIISLNYDLVLEKTLNLAGKEYYRVGSDEEKKGLPIFKTHGSIDFDICNESIQVPDSIRWRAEIFDNQTSNDGGKTYINIINEDEYLRPRAQQDIIPPTQKNSNRHLPWVESNFMKLKELLVGIDSFVMMGFSYSSPDQEEFDEFLDYIKNKNVHFYDINLDPNDDLCKAIESRGHKYLFKKLELPW